jgi:hypothetical protein
MQPVRCSCPYLALQQPSKLLMVWMSLSDELFLRCSANSFRRLRLAFDATVAVDEPIRARRITFPQFELINARSNATRATVTTNHWITSRWLLMSLIFRRQHRLLLHPPHCPPLPWRRQRLEPSCQLYLLLGRPPPHSRLAHYQAHSRTDPLVDCGYLHSGTDYFSDSHCYI